MGRLKNWILRTFYRNDLIAMQKEYDRKVREISYNAQKQTKLIDAVHRVFKESNWFYVKI